MERYIATQFYKADSPESRILGESGLVPSEFVLAADAQRALDAEREKVKELVANQAEYEKCTDEQITALNQGCLDYEKQIATLQAQLAVVTAVGAITHQTDEPREDYIDRVTLNWLASTVKLADIADNINPVRIREWEEVSGKSKASYVRGRLADYNRIVEALKQVSTEHKEQV